MGTLTIRNLDDRVKQNCASARRRAVFRWSRRSRVLRNVALRKMRRERDVASMSRVKTPALGREPNDRSI